MATRRQVIAGLLSGFAAPSLAAPPNLFRFGSDPPVLKIAFGSCVSQRKDQSFWPNILAHDPHAFVMMGDGIYPDQEAEGLPVLEAIEAGYRQASTRTELADFRRQVPVIAIWDDNDYGGSDIGESFRYKRRSKELFLDFWTTTEEKRVRDRETGIFGLWEFGPVEHRVQVIVPDLRYCRSEWAQTEETYLKALEESGFGPYVTDTAPDVTMLGEAQWQWLEDCFRRPASVRLFVSSIQCIPEGRGWESWSNFPNEKARLFDLIRDTVAEGVVFLSGDTHYAEISRLDESPVRYPLWEATSSGLTELWPVPGPNPHRVGVAYPTTNFGVVHVHWDEDQTMIVLEIYATTGERLRQQSIMLDSLRVQV